MRIIINKYQNLILTTTYLLTLILFVSFRYDFYFALNDDVLMKDLLAGFYTGTPESRNIQMLYPLSLIISLLYRLIPIVPWYGFFLCICQFGSIFIIALCSLKYCRNILKKSLLLLCQFCLIIATMLEHLIFVQYTITSAMLTAAAVFYFITSGHKETIVAFIKVNLPAIILIFIAFLLRPWMLLLLFPLVCVAGVFKWSQENPIFTKPNFKKYFALFGLLVLVLLVGQLVDMLAHSSAEWRKFNRFFANRTELYDFQKIPPYDENVIFYEDIGLSYSEVNLLLNYNFGLSEKIDEDVIGEIAAYAGQIRGENLSFRERFDENLRTYYFYMTNGGEHGHYPYNSLILLGYAALLGLGNFYNRLGRIASMFLLLGGVRSGLWLFILMGDRYPPRISHSLYFVEMGILLAMFLTEVVKKVDTINRKKPLSDSIYKSFPPIIAAVAVVIALGNIPLMLDTTDKEFSSRETVNQTWLAMQEYSRAHPDNFYFIDVYSSVPYSEKLFGKPHPRPANYDIMGGWAVKSPLHRKKMDNLIRPGISMFAALLEDNVYFINDLRFDPAWLPAYYAEQGQAVNLERVDLIADNLNIYKLR